MSIDGLNKALSEFKKDIEIKKESLKNFRDSYDITPVLLKNPLQVNEMINLIFASALDDGPKELRNQIPIMTFGNYIKSHLIKEVKNKELLKNYFEGNQFFGTIMNNFDFISLIENSIECLYLDKVLAKSIDKKVIEIKGLKELIEMSCKTSQDFINEELIKESGIKNLNVSENSLVINNYTTIKDLILYDAFLFNKNKNKLITKEGESILETSRPLMGMLQKYQDLIKVFNNPKDLGVLGLNEIIEKIKSLEKNDFIVYIELTKNLNEKEVNQKIKEFEKVTLKEYESREKLFIDYNQKLIKELGETHKFLINRMFELNGDIELLIAQMKNPIKQIKSSKIYKEISINNPLSLLNNNDLSSVVLNNFFGMSSELKELNKRLANQHNELMNYQNQKPALQGFENYERIVSLSTDHDDCMKCLLYDYLTQVCLKLKDNPNYYNKLIGDKK